MKKTKINVGAILLIVYAVMAYMISSNAITRIFDQFFYSANLSNIGGFSLNDLFGITTMRFIALISLFSFGIVLLSGKKWGAVAMGATMAAASVATIVPISSMVGALIPSSIIYGGAEFAIVLIAIVILTIFICFIALPGFLGWTLYAIAGVFSMRAQKNGKKSLLALISKIAAAVLVLISGLSLIFITMITVFLIIAMVGYLFLPALLTIVSISGLTIVLSLVSLLILAAGMVLSVKCKPDGAPKAKAAAEIMEAEEETEAEVEIEEVK